MRTRLANIDHTAFDDLTFGKMIFLRLIQVLIIITQWIHKSSFKCSHLFGFFFCRWVTSYLACKRTAFNSIHYGWNWHQNEKKSYSFDIKNYKIFSFKMTKFLIKIKACLHSDSLFFSIKSWVTKSILVWPFCQILNQLWPTSQKVCPLLR